MNQNENKPKQTIDPKEELKHIVKQAFSEIERSFQIIIKSLKAPFKGITNLQGYAWKEIIVTFVVMTLLVTIVEILISGLFWSTLLGSFYYLIKSFVIYAVIIGLTWLVLDNIQKGIKAQELFECWLMALIPTTILSIIISVINALSFRLMWLGYFSTTIFFIIILAFLFYLGLMARFSLPRKTAGLMAAGIGILLILLNFTFGLFGYSLGRGHYYINPLLNHKLSELNKNLEDIRKGYEQIYTDTGIVPPKKNDNDSDNRDPKRKIKLSRKALRYIEKTYKDPKQRAAVIQDAKALELMILSAMNEGGISREYAKNEGMRSSSCIIETIPDWNEDNSRDLYKVVIDTPAKVRAFAKWNQSWSGKLVGYKDYSEEEACN